MSSPLVSVVLPCFNAERYLPAALDSILKQTYRKLEVIALDDGSADGTVDILKRYAESDARVSVLRSSSNHGLIRTLNRGVAAAHGDVIARMDADDISAPERLERQVEALSRNTDIDVVGSGVEIVSANGSRLRPRPVRCLGPGAARFMGLLGTPVAHPTLAARTKVLRMHPYAHVPEALHTEDYELFARLLSQGVSFMNIPDALVTVRIDPTGVSLRHEQIQVANFLTCSRRYLEETLSCRPSAAVHRVLVNRLDDSVGPRDLSGGLRLLEWTEQGFMTREPSAVADIRRTADLQRVDILVQAMRRGTPPVRRAAALLFLRFASCLTRPAARRYLASKLYPRQALLPG